MLELRRAAVLKVRRVLMLEHSPLFADSPISGNNLNEFAKLQGKLFR